MKKWSLLSTFVVVAFLSLAKAEDSCYTVDDSDYRWASLLGETAPWPPQCTGCSTSGAADCSDYPCWCIPEGGNDGCCPAPGNRPLQYEWQVAEAFKRNVDTDPIVFSPSGCNPHPENQELYSNLPFCTEFNLWDRPNAVCAFIYEDSDEDCGGLEGRNYRVQSFSSAGIAEADGGVVTHHGACGVCSNANDLAVMMDLRNSFDKISDFCAAEFVDADVTANSPVQGGLTYECYKGLGFTDQCAFIHASTDIAGRNCTLPCRAALADPDVTGTSTSCEWTGCASCQQSFRMQNGVDAHLKWAGRDLWSSEIISYNPFYHLKRPCSDWEETDGSIITQDPYAQGNKAESISQSGSQSADRFDPSYSIVRHSETCRYEVRFSMKHDKTLPNAGGWNPVYPQGVDRQEFDRLCNRDSNEIAEDGLPYNVPREFTFTFGDDVREVTGIFDHVAIVYNPCGSDVQGLSRPHYDFRMFTVSESWREIMQCDVTPCDPSTCIFDGTFQTSDSGKAFFETDTCYEDPGIPDPLAEPGSFNKNMPFGFFTLANMANPLSGTTSMNLFTNLDWNETTVDSWSDPIFTMRSFAGLVTGFEPKIPAEFLQGTEEKEYTSPETSNTCQTLFNLPSASIASYNPDTGFTTLSFSGISPSCACGPETNTSVTDGDCEVLEADLKSYDAVYERFAGQPQPEHQDNKTAFGRFSVADVESAFGLVPGSLWIPGTEEFDCLSSSNFWTDYVGIPLIQERLRLRTTTARNQQFESIERVSTPFFSYEEDKHLEHFLLGCFYRPKSPEINEQLVDLDAGQCADEGPDAFTGSAVEYHVVGYVDEFTRLMFFGLDSSFANDAQFMTQFVLMTALPDYDKKAGEAFAFEMKGPNFGDYSNYADPEEIAEADFLGNLGHFDITLSIPDLSQNCPDSICGSIIPGFISNPEAPNAPWPAKILEKQCDWFPCASLQGCEEVVCDKYEPGKCVLPGPPTASPVMPTPDGSGNTDPPAPSKVPDVRGAFVSTALGLLLMAAMLL